MKNFNAYAEANYTNQEQYRVPGGFLDASKMNSVRGDQENSLLSPLRVELFSELTILSGVVGAIITIAEHHAELDASSGGALTGSAVLIASAGIIRHRAKQAVNSVLKRGSNFS
jgi:hypothetical protein